MSSALFNDEPKINKIISCFVVGISLLTVLPTGVNAEWRLDNKGWWYAEGNSYYKDQWALINGKWYYFNYSGYLVENAWIFDGNYVDSNGEWIKSSIYKREDIVDNAAVGNSQKGKKYYEAGDKGVLSVINGEPCVYTWDENDRGREIGMNTLNVYDENNMVVDKLVF